MRDESQKDQSAEYRRTAAKAAAGGALRPGTVRTEAEAGRGRGGFSEQNCRNAQPGFRRGEPAASCRERRGHTSPARKAGRQGRETDAGPDRTAKSRKKSVSGAGAGRQDVPGKPPESRARRGAGGTAEDEKKKRAEDRPQRRPRAHPGPDGAGGTAGGGRDIRGAEAARSPFEADRRQCSHGGQG